MGEAGRCLLKVEVFDQNNAKEWNNIIDQSINGTLFHTWEWLRIVEKHSDSKLLPLVYFDTDDNKPFGAIPLFLKKRLGLKMVFSPPPGTSITLGPTIIEKGYKQHKFELAYLDFQRSMDNYIGKLGANYVYIITSPGLLDIRPFSWAQYQVTPSYTYRIDLSRSEKDLWGNLSPSLKREINQTRNKGVQVVKNNFNKRQIVDYVYDSLVDCYDKQHLKLSLKKAYLENIQQQLDGSRMKILVAKNDDKVIGAQIFVTYKNIITGWVGSIRPGPNDLEVNGLMLWESISDGIKEGYRWLENMGANTPHLCSYKAKFGPQVALYFEMKKTDLPGYLAEKAYLLRRKNGAKEKEMSITSTGDN
jgi:hypothetical protein